MSSESKLLFTEEVADMLRVTPDTVRDLVAEGVLRAVRLRTRGRLMFDLADVRNALREARGGVPAVELTLPVLPPMPTC
jgi:excisionase family DNA binding protein